MLFPVRKIFWILIIIAGGILAMYTFNTLSIHFLPKDLPNFFLTRFDINAEANVPTWYATFLLISVSLAALLILRLQRQLSAADPARRTFWYVLVAVFLFFSMDEAAMLHEILDQTTSIKWVFFYGPLAVAFFIYCVLYWRHQPQPERQPGRWIVGGLAVFFLGAGVMEWVSYTFYLPYAYQQIEYVLEEGMEMLGVIGVLIGCLLEANRLFGLKSEQ